nr:T9SS type A sorting domain-containing protein [uncultured Flavobacterium sp.]
MKYFYLLFCLTFVGFTNAQIINFPDANFKAKLLQPNVAHDDFYQPITIDANNDGEIEMSEVEAVVFLNVSNSNISDLTGISNFVNLWSLQCQNNLLTSLVIDSSIGVKDLNASNNQLNSISIHFVTGDMEYETGINLSNNNLTTFSIADCVIWDGLNLSNNQLTSLNISHCSINGLNVNNNNLTSIQFSGFCNIGGSLNFRNNQFTLLDLSAASIDPTSLVYLGNNIEDRINNVSGNIVYSSNNTFFDLGNYNNVTDCDPEYLGHVTISNSPNLQNVIFKNGFNHTTIICDEGGNIFQNPAMSLSISNCPNLSFICVDEEEQSYFQVWIEQMGLQSQVQVNSNCTSSVLGIQTFVSEEQFIISPVPAHNILQIHTIDSLQIRALEIYNNLGQLVQKESGNWQTIEISRLAKGSYYLKIQMHNSFCVKQFLKE